LEVTQPVRDQGRLTERYRQMDGQTDGQNWRKETLFVSPNFSETEKSSSL